MLEPSAASSIPEPEGKLTAAQEIARHRVLSSSATHCCLGGGSRSGKTLLIVRQVIMRAMRAEGSRHGICRFRFNSVKNAVIHDTLPKAMKLFFPGFWEHCDLNKTDWFLTLPNGSEIWFFGLDDKERTEKILGMEFATLYFNECSQIPWQSVVMALTRLAQKTILQLRAFYDFNPPSKAHWTYRLFVEKKDPISKKPVADEFDYGFYLLNPMDNIENLDPKYIKMLEGMDERSRNRFLLGKFADVDDGALWTIELLEQQRVLDTRELPDFLRIVIAVDPSGCHGEEDYRSDEVGIAVAALGTNGFGYLLEDLSGRYGPGDWGRIVADAFKRHGADRVVGEENYGGAMVEHVVRSVDPMITYSSVKATRGKVVRAEPISSLYEQGKLFHVGYHPELEDQLCAMTTSGYKGDRSPDRADAAIWGFTELFPAMSEMARVETWSQPKISKPARKATRYQK